MHTDTARRCSGKTFSRFLAAFALLFTITATPLTAQLNLIRQGPESAGTLKSFARMGHCVVAGDFNGDGMDDLASGVPNDKIGNLIDAGSVVINYCTQFGLTYVGAELLTASNLGETSTSGALFGYALVAADFNHDGYCDLAIGAPYETVNGLVNAGRVYLVYGSASGLNSTTVAISEESGGAGTVAANDNFGFALAAGNFDDDPVGYNDLAVGAPGVASGAGAVYVNYLGSFLGITTGVATSFKQSTLGFNDHAGDGFGRVLAAGNYMGSAEADLAVGVPYKTYLGTANVGVVYLIQGSGSALIASGAKQYTDVVKGTQLNGYFGYALATGHFTDDSHADLAIGEPGHIVDGQQNAGVVILAAGNVTGLKFHATGFMRANSVTVTNYQFGQSVACGDWVGSGPQDIAVGTPQKLFGFGQVDLFINIGGFDTVANSTFTQSYEGERPTPGDHFGYSLAFGNFDNVGKQSLVVGAPDKSTSNDVSYNASGIDALEFTGAGEVFNIAPWRQATKLSCANAIVTDCSNEIVFAQRPFDRVRIASITKVMTVLLACEHIQASVGSPLHMDSNAVYTVPQWVSDNIPGSQANLVEGEKMSLIDLMFSCLMVSGNDAAHAIGDLLYGSTGPNLGLALFVNEMNTRAAQLGMTGTHFTNPAGLDKAPVGPNLGDHHSTPMDYIKLARYAMQNPMFARIAGTSTRNILRHYPFFDLPWQCNNIFGGILKLPYCVGIKGGSTTKAQASGCFAARNPALPGMAVACTFGTPLNASGVYGPDCMSLLTLGLSYCSPLPPLATDLTQEPPFNFVLGDVPTSKDTRTSGGGGDQHGRGRELKFEIKPQKGDPEPRFQFDLTHTSNVVIDVRDTIALGVAPFKSHKGIRLTNMNDSTIDISVQTSDNRAPVRYVLSYGDQVLIPPFESEFVMPAYAVTLKNNSPYEVEVGVDEEYNFDFNNAAGPIFSPSLLSWSPGAVAAPSAGPEHGRTIQSAVSATSVVTDNFSFEIVGEDSSAGNSILIGVHPADESIDGTYLNTVQTGWNMVSLPLQVNDLSAAHLYPASASHAFSFSGGYHPQDTLANGKGYWLKFDTTGYLTMDGSPLLAETIAVADKWNLIGSVGVPVPVAAVGQVPSGIVSSPFYGYNGGYFIADTIQPGKAYWVKVAGGGSLSLSAGAFAAKSSTPVSPDYSGFNSLTIEHESSGGKQVLYFGNRELVRDGAELKFLMQESELPPAPPVGIFDARFASGRMLDLVESGTTGCSKVDLGSADGGLTISWKINDPSLRARINIAGRVINIVGTGSTRITNHETVMTLEYSATATLPDKFALAQNYPNPFNPSTNISFELPEPSTVSLRIYNVLGQEVATLINNQSYDAGRWARQFNEPRLSSGVYFYRLEARSINGGSHLYSEQRKMILLK